MGDARLADAGAPAELRAQRTARRALRFVHLLRALPFERGLALGAALGRAWVRASGPRVHDARVNLRIAFPEWSEPERERVLLRSFENVGRSFVEFAWIGGTSEAEFRERVRVEGLEHLEAALAGAEGPGALILTAHFGSWEYFSAAMVAHGYPLTVIHRGRENAVLHEMLAEVRGASGAELFQRGSAARGALRALREGRLLCVPFDQNANDDDGVYVRFFGRFACTRDGPTRLAMRTRVPVVPAFIHREPDGVHHVVRLRPAVALVADEGDREAAVRENVARMTAAIEREIRGAPEQWVWLHRRWRRQPRYEPRPPYR